MALLYTNIRQKDPIKRRYQFFVKILSVNRTGQLVTAWVEAQEKKHNANKAHTPNNIILAIHFIT